MENKALSDLNKFKVLVNKELDLFFNKRIEETNNLDTSIKEMIELTRDYSSGGKRIRAALVYYGYQCFKETNLKEVLKASICTELIHSFFLIHDDIIDQDDLRRNLPTIHKSYEKICSYKYPLTKDKSHFGISMGIIAGDLLVSFASQVLTNSNFNNKIKIKTIKRLNQIIVSTVYGQTFDILSGMKKEFTKEDVFDIYKYKTARYTVEGPLHLGAILAGASKNHLKILSNYADPIGFAFQIQDDILGIFSSEKKLGKPICSDFREGRKNLLILTVLEKTAKKDRLFVQKCLGNQNLSKKDVAHIRLIIKSSGALDYCKDYATKLINDSKKIIKNAKFKKPGKDFLLGIADYMLERDY